MDEDDAVREVGDEVIEVQVSRFEFVVEPTIESAKLFPQEGLKKKDALQ